MDYSRRAKENLSDPAANTPNDGLAALPQIAEPSIDELTRQGAVPSVDELTRHGAVFNYKAVLPPIAKPSVDELNRQGAVPSVDELTRQGAVFNYKAVLPQIAEPSVEELTRQGAVPSVDELTRQGAVFNYKAVLPQIAEPPVNELTRQGALFIYKAVLPQIAEPYVDELTRQGAVLNHLKTRWVLSSCSSAATPTIPDVEIPDVEKVKIKDLVKSLMLSSATQREVKSLLSEAVAVIGKHDFPDYWSALLPPLETSVEIAVNANNFASVNHILAILNALYKRFPRESNSSSKEPESKLDQVDLTYCSDQFAARLLTTAASISRKLNAGVGSVAILRQLLEAGRLCCRIFYSLNYQNVPEEFEGKADEWMNEFKMYLTPAVILEDADADCLSLVDELRAAVCENIILYMEKSEGLLEKHLSDFVPAVCGLLVGGVTSERLTATGIKFLSMVSRSNVHHELFAGDEILHQIILDIVIPNVMLIDEDEELFQKKYLEFLRRDYMERNDGHPDTRRTLACELLKGIAGNYKQKIAQSVSISTQIHKCLTLFDKTQDANWKDKVSAINLVVSLASVSTDLVDVESFFGSVIVPELQGQDLNAFPVLKAAALKFFTMFRVLIPKHVAMPLLGHVVRYIYSGCMYVRSYAAICIEKLLLVKDNNNGLQPRYTSMDIDPILEDLCCNLFIALEHTAGLEVDQYFMGCINRVFQMPDLSLDMPLYCLPDVNQVLIRVISRPHNPVFNYLLFQAVATIVRRVFEKDPRSCEMLSILVGDFELHIKNILYMIMSIEATELYPYVFQLLAQLVDLNGPPVPPIYMVIFDEIMSSETPDLWQNPANVPALVCLLQSFLQQAPNEVNRKGRLKHVVGKINILVPSPNTEEEGFHLLNTVIETYGYVVIAEYINDIWASLFTLLQNVKTPRLVRCVIVFMSLFLVKHGVETLVDLINSGNADLFHVILGEYWIPHLMTITGHWEVKLTTVASTKLLCESPSLLDLAAEELWGKLLDATVTLLSLPQEERVEDDDEPQILDLTVGYPGSKFFRLQNAAGKTKEDPLKEIKDPKQFFVGFPANISSEFRGRFPLVVTKYLSPPNQAALVKLCNSYNILIL